MRKIIIIIAIIAAGIIAGLTIFNVIQEKNHKANALQANERLLMEKEYMDNLSEYISQVDDVTAAYVSAQIDKNAYLERHQVLKNEYTIIKNEFTAWLVGHPIETGSESYVSKRGEQAIENTQKDIDGLLECTFKDGEVYDIYELYYRYLSQKEKIQTDYIEYIVAYRWITEKDTVEQDVDTIMEEYEALKEEEQNTLEQKETIQSEVSNE